MILSSADGRARTTTTAGIAGKLEACEDKSSLPRNLITENEKAVAREGMRRLR